jgi:hypothetical protein
MVSPLMACNPVAPAILGAILGLVGLAIATTAHAEPEERHTPDTFSSKPDTLLDSSQIIGDAWRNGRAEVEVGTGHARSIHP